MKKGFTLIELIITIALLGLIGTIIATNMTGILDSEQEKEYKKSKKTNTLSNFNTGKNVKEEVLPDWFNQSIKKEEISADDEKSLKDMLKEFS